MENDARYSGPGEVRVRPLEECRPGDIVLFGQYPQNSDDPEPVEWEVLTRDGAVVQMISRYSLAILQYDRNGGIGTSWRSSLLREWLNSAFVQNAFGAEEAMRLVTADVPADPDDVTPTGLDPEFRTRDRVYLLNKSEAERFFPSEAARVCGATPWAKQDSHRDYYWFPVCVDDRIIEEKKRGGRDLDWWLRSREHSCSDAVSRDGSFRKEHFEARLAVRPVIRVRCTEAPEARRETLGTCLPGDVVVYGSYPRCGSDPGPVEWQVLSREGSAVRLISRYALDAMQWHETHEPAAWESCSLREWLNGEFLDTAFSEEELAHLAAVNAGCPDRATLLNETELRRYFPRRNLSRCFPTVLAIQRGRILRRYLGPCWWWLRSEGTDPFCAVGVNDLGRFRRAGRYICADGGIRPVILVQV